MTHIVATGGLTKRYGDRTVVDQLDLRVPQGCVYGFLGPNGSGKSTTMKMLLSLVRPTSGTVEVMGEPMTRDSRHRLLPHIGSLIESPPGYAHLTGAENMELVRRRLGLDRERITAAVATVRLQDQMDKKVRAYSLGMTQRLGIAMALARDPRLLVLDEPTNGLDPAGIAEMRDLLRHLAESGVTVIVSSHLLGEIDRCATVLGILDRGQMLFQGPRDELMSAASPEVTIGCADARTATGVLAHRGARTTGTGEVTLPCPDDAATSAAVADLVGAGIGVHRVERSEPTLEDVFRDLTGGGEL